MFGMQLCLAAGIQPIITSSDDKKIQYIESLSPKVRGINYKTHPDQSAEVLRLTDGKGVDFVVNNTGVGSIPTDIGLLRKRGGTVSLVGFLDGFQADWSPDALFLLMSKTAQLRSVIAPRNPSVSNGHVTHIQSLGASELVRERILCV